MTRYFFFYPNSLKNKRQKTKVLWKLGIAVRQEKPKIIIINNNNIGHPLKMRKKRVVNKHVLTNKKLFWNPNPNTFICTQPNKNSIVYPIKMSEPMEDHSSNWQLKPVKLISPLAFSMYLYFIPQFI